MSLKKHFNELKAKQERQRELQRQKEAEEARAVAAKKDEKENLYSQYESRLRQVLDEIDIESYLWEIRNDFWKMGEVTVGPIERYERFGVEEVKCIAEIEAKWKIFVPGEVHEYEVDGERRDDYSPPCIRADTASLRVEIYVIYGEVSIRVESQDRFDYNGPEDKVKLEKALATDVLNLTHPLTKMRDEAAREIQDFRLRHPSRPLEDYSNL